MPELSDQMYCSEQIAIPPPFPYLLRQYAKAAIRTQPTDLLKWSTAYFRCLSLNVPPPVKPRLEYPIPRDYCGITPGWLKALLYQLQNNRTIPFKVLWDRWTGACLEHNTLIQILLLGGFDNANAIPWLRFAGLCAAHLTDDLTHTMILICEIMTEEPDGGSAMIPLETFLELYKFLAKIDASQPQTLKNKYFTDTLLDLWREKIDKEEITVETKEVSVYEEESVQSVLSTRTDTEEMEKEPSKEQISCPSIGHDDYSMDYYMQAIASETEEQTELIPDYPRPGEIEYYPTEGEGQREESALDLDEEEKEIKSEAESEEKGEGAVSKKGSEEVEGDKIMTEEVGSLKEEADEKETSNPELVTDVQEYESVDTIIEEPRKIEPEFEDERALYEDLQRLKTLQQEIPGETDEELERYKCELMKQIAVVDEQPLDLSPYNEITKDEDEGKASVKEIPVKVEVDKQQEEKYENVHVPKIPGIGPVVADDLVKAVCDYMKGMAAIQHGMVMPRNMRHYNCPPLELLEY